MKRFKLFLIISLSAFVLFSNMTYAGNESKKGTGGAQELLLPVGARGAALGGSNIADAYGLEAIHWNPAGLATQEGVAALFSRMNYIADIGLNFGAVSVTIPGAGTIGLSLRTVDFGDIPVTTEDFPEGTGATFSPSFSTVGLTYAKSVTDRISVGATVKFVSEKIMRVSASTFSFDAGVQYEFQTESVLKGLKFAVALKNLGPTMQYDGTDLERLVIPPNTAPGNVPRPLKYSSQEFELPSTLELGMSYHYEPITNNKITVMGMFQNNNFGIDEYKLGLEYSFAEMIAIRGGYVMAPQENKDAFIYGLSMGAGLNFDLGGMKFGLDYAYRETKIFQGTNTIAVQLEF